jgi:hypothetical protein
MWLMEERQTGRLPIAFRCGLVVGFRPGPLLAGQTDSAASSNWMVRAAHTGWTRHGVNESGCGATIQYQRRCCWPSQSAVWPILLAADFFGRDLAGSWVESFRNVHFKVVLRLRANLDADQVPTRKSDCHRSG